MAGNGASSRSGIPPRPRLRSALARRIGRGAKYVRLLPARGQAGDRHAVFIVGSQRSGTTMLTDTFARSSSTWVYQEYSRRAFKDFRLRDAATVDRLVERAPAPVVVFKPICDSHLTDRLLERHGGSQAIWIFRHYGAVARSAVAKWGTHFDDVTRAVAEGRGEEVGWRAERLSARTVELVRELRGTVNEDVPLAGAMLFWLMRNRFFFELGLDRDDRVQPVSYEEIAARPVETLSGMFRSTGTRVDASTFDGIDTRSLSTSVVEGVDPALIDACEELQARLKGVLRDGALRSSAPPQAQRASDEPS